MNRYYVYSNLMYLIFSIPYLLKQYPSDLKLYWYYEYYFVIPLWFINLLLTHINKFIVNQYWRYEQKRVVPI